MTRARDDRRRGGTGGRRPGAGRPPAGLPPPVRTTVYLSPEEAAPIEAEARSEGVSRAVILRRGLGLQRDTVGDLRVSWRRTGVADLHWGSREHLQHRRLIGVGGDWGIGTVTTMSPIPNLEYEARGPALAVVEAWWAQRLAPTRTTSASRRSSRPIATRPRRTGSR